MYVTDTNTLIYFFKGSGNVAQKLLSIPPKEIGIPSIVLYELEVGIAKSKSPRKRLKQLEDMMSIITVLPFTAKEARCSAMIRAQLERKGIPI
jgi:tRNA(fMet)-specific endonuclease VapC